MPGSAESWACDWGGLGRSGRVWDCLGLFGAHWARLIAAKSPENADLNYRSITPEEPSRISNPIPPLAFEFDDRESRAVLVRQKTPPCGN
jgi:hypothetical protein